MKIKIKIACVSSRIVLEMKNSLTRAMFATVVAVSMSATSLALAATPVQAQLPLNWPSEISGFHHGEEPTALGSLFGNRYVVRPGSQEVIHRRSEKGSASDSFKRENETYAVSYFLIAFAYREGGDDLFLSGMKADGTTIIERWTINPGEQRWVVRYPNPTPDIGTPADTYTPTITVKNGTSWKWNSKFSPIPPVPRVQRTVMYEGIEGPFTAMSADPEGRFLLMWDYQNKSLRRVILTAQPPTIETLWSSTTFPELIQVSSIEVRDYASEGRKYFMRRNWSGGLDDSADEIIGIVHDSENDGILESLSFFDVTQFQASQYSTWANWSQFWRDLN